jgi:hypothetical protein
LHAHGKLKGGGGDSEFWGQFSWQRKWKPEYDRSRPGILDRPTGFERAPTTYYYKLFNLAYKEKFPGSATIFVSFTDGPHLMQSVYLLAFCASIGVHTEHPILYTIGYRVVFGIIFTITYSLLGRK